MNARPSWRSLLTSALRKRCPRCATGPLFRRWYTLHDRCTACGIDFQPVDGNTWFFMYFSSAAVVGVCFLYLLFFPPASAATGWMTIVPAACLLMFITLPHRKSLAVAFDYYLSPDDDAPRVQDGRG